MKKVTKAFCLGDRIGVVTDGNFYAVEYNKLKFLRIVVRAIKRHKSYKCMKPDVLAKWAIREYCGVNEVARAHKRHGISESIFYTKIRTLIANNRTFIRLYNPEKQKKERRGRINTYWGNK